MKILLIHQDSSISASFEAFARVHGHQLSCCSTASPAEAALEKDHYSLVAVEMSEGREQWPAALAAQRRRRPETSLVFLGDGSDEQIERALELGGEAYLTLPLRAVLLDMTLRPLLKKSELLSVPGTRAEASKMEEELRNSQRQQKEALAEKDLTYRELLLAYSRLQELNQQKNNFLATATHELRTPVTVIKGYHRILLDGRLGELLPQQKEVLLESEQSCSRLIKIINSLLDLSRIEAGKLDLIYQDYDVAANLKIIASQLKEASKRKRLAVTLKVDKELPRLRCDREKINQVLTNLLENAIKYTPAGGKIWVLAQLCSAEAKTTPAPAGNMSLGGASEALSVPCLMIQVSDTGIGISPEHQQEIFEQFTQVSSNQMDRSGLGLGLAISKRIIQAHGGKIWVESQGSSGSRFTFLLPLTPAEAPAAVAETC